MNLAVISTCRPLPALGRTSRKNKDMTTHISWRSLRVAFLALIVGALAFAGLAMPSSAQTTTGNIDTTATGSLTIHKHDQKDSPLITGDHDGQEITGVTAEGLDGVTFSVQRVTDIDLTTAAGWVTAGGLSVEDAQSRTLGTDFGGSTANGGILTITDLPIGLYLVQETAPGPNNIVAPAAPFLVAVPQPLGDGEWLYDVHVYPKNSLVDAPVKEVDDAAAYKLGDTVTWTIKSQVPVMSAGNSYSDYRITDDLDDRLNFVSATVSGAGLVDGDYTITPEQPTADGPDVTVVLTESGLAKLNALTAPAEITVTIETTVNSIGDGTIENDATVFINNKGTDSNTVDTEWGALKVTKKVEGQEQFLQDAKFDLYVNNGTPDAPEQGDLVLEGLITGEDGTFLVEGLKAGEYLLVETEAPAGFEVLVDPIAVTIVAGTVDSPNVYTIDNVQQPPFELPLTGGIGTMGFSIAGLALLALAGASYLLIRQRRQN